MKIVYCTQITFLCPFVSKSLKTQIKRLKMVKHGQKRQNDSKTSKWSIALKLRFHANLSRIFSKFEWDDSKWSNLAKNVEMTQKPQNGLLHSNYVFMLIWVEIAQNSTKTFKNGQIWSKTSKWLKNLKMVYCTQITFLCQFESKSLKTYLKWLKMVK